MGFGQVIPVLTMAATTGILPAPPMGPIPVRIQFEAPPGCSDADAFYTGIRVRTSRVRLIVGAGPQASTNLRVRLTRAPNRVQGELRIVDLQGEADTRQLEGSSCDEVAQALALTAALALDSNVSAAAASPVPPSPAGASPAGASPAGASPAGASPAGASPAGATPAGTSPTGASPAAPPPALPTAALPVPAGAGAIQPALGSSSPRLPGPSSPSGVSPGATSGADASASNMSPPAPPPEGSATEGHSDRSLATGRQESSRDRSVASASVELGLQAVAASLGSSSPSAGGAIGARLRFAPSRLQPSVGISLWWLRNDLLASPQQALLELTGVVLTACPSQVLLSGALRVEPCAVLTAGWLGATGRGVDFPETKTLPFPTAGGLLRFSLLLGSAVRAELEGAAAVPFIRRAFTITDSDGVTTPRIETSPLTYWGALGLGYLF